MNLKPKTFNRLVMFVALITLIGVGYVGYKYIYLRNAYFRLEKTYLTEVNQNSLAGKLNSIRNELYFRNSILTDDLSSGYDLFPDATQVSINQKALKPYNENETATILTFGHIYASAESAVPARVLTENIGLINHDIQPDMVVLMGDLVKSPSPETFSALEEGFINPLNMPVYNTPGNHDFYAGRQLYQEHFGQSFYSFTHGPAQLIFLDTEIGNCFILGKQKEMFDQALNQAESDPNIHYVFIFMHKVLFQNLNLPGVGQLITNHEYCDLFGSNFEEILNHSLIPLSEQKAVYVFAGDVGKSGNEFSYFTSQMEDTQVYLNTTGIGEQPADAALLITYDQNAVTLTKYPLNP